MADTEVGELKGDVRVLAQAVKSGQEDTNRRLDKIESKIDAQSNVPVATFEEYRKEAEDKFAKKTDLNSTNRLVWLLLAGVAGIAFAVIQDKLTKG